MNDILKLYQNLKNINRLLRVILQQLENLNKEELLKQFNLQGSYIPGDSIRLSGRFGSSRRSDSILLNFR